MKHFEHGYALVVGVAGYRTPELPPLPLAVLNDAVDLARALWNPESCGYRADRVRLLLEEQATAEGIREGLEWLIDRTTEDDTAIFFFSGHGCLQDGRSHLAAHDAALGSTEPTGTIAGEELTGYLHTIPAGRLAVFLDCCHAGGIGEIKGAGDEARSPIRKHGLDTLTYEKLAAGRGRVLVASSGPKEVSEVSGQERNSLFTSFLVRGLLGEAGKAGSDTVGIFDLFDFVATGVQQLSGRRQSPFWKGRVRDNFAIAVRPKRAKLTPQQAPVREPESLVRAGRDINAISIEQAGDLKIGGS